MRCASGIAGGIQKWRVHRKVQRAHANYKTDSGDRRNSDRNSHRRDSRPADIETGEHTAQEVDGAQRKLQDEVERLKLELKASEAAVARQIQTVDVLTARLTVLEEERSYKIATAGLTEVSRAASLKASRTDRSSSRIARQNSEMHVHQLSLCRADAHKDERDEWRQAVHDDPDQGDHTRERPPWSRKSGCDEVRSEKAQKAFDHLAHTAHMHLSSTDPQSSIAAAADQELQSTPPRSEVQSQPAPAEPTNPAPRKSAQPLPAFTSSRSSAAEEDDARADADATAEQDGGRNSWAEASGSGAAASMRQPEPRQDGSTRPDHGWSAAAWVRELKLEQVVADALLLPILSLDPPSRAQFTYCKGLSRAELRQLLDEGLLDGIEQALWAGIQKLQSAVASSGKELCSKFAAESDYTLEYGSLEVFYQGIEGMLGPPAMNVLEGMEREHCSRPDADVTYTTCNGMRTTSRVEFEFVVRPRPGTVYPERPDIMRGSEDRRRKPLAPEAFSDVLRSVNARLTLHGHSTLMLEEQISARLYTGPQYEKLNAVLRALSNNPVLKRRFNELCHGNTYATTIHSVSSCVLKLSQLAVATKVYRGLKGASLPASFFVPDEFGVCGGVEYGFTSTSTAKAEALEYANSVARGQAGASCPTLLELDQGLVSRGADVSIFSQYPHESEVLFSPMLGVEVVGTRVEGGVLVVQMRVTVNMTALTLEQQLSKRRRLVQQMCDSIEQELKGDLATDDWIGMAQLRGVPSEEHDDANQDDQGGLDGHIHAQATLHAEMAAVVNEEPEYYNCDQAWGDAIARAVAALQQVSEWPAALQRLCEDLHETPAGLMQAKQLVVNFHKFGQAEAEVLELLLRVSPALHGLTLHSDHGREWDEAQWARCVSAVARGVAASSELVTLNLRHFSLHGAAGLPMAAALKQHPSLTALRLVHNGLDASFLDEAIRGNMKLRTLELQNNPLPEAPLEVRTAHTPRQRCHDSAMR